MHICLVIDAQLPTQRYGGTERVVYWLGRALHQAGHKVTFLAQQSQLDFANVLVLDKTRSIESQIPKEVDIVHMHSGFKFPQNIPTCQTIHGNCRHPTTFHPNSIFVSNSHAQNHNATAFVHNGLDASDYGSVDFSTKKSSFVFLAKAAWGVKNVRGAIDVAALTESTIDILGGHRLNFKMGFRLTLAKNARFHGMVDDKVKIPFLQQARGLVFPVLWHEPFGVATIEAMYFGVPIFGTPYGALPEIVGEGAGFLSNSTHELAEAAKNWRSYDRAAIHAHWKQCFTSSIMAKKYIEYYTMILDGQNLHANLIHAQPVRTSKLLDWKP